MKEQPCIYCETPTTARYGKEQFVVCQRCQRQNEVFTHLKKQNEYIAELEAALRPFTIANPVGIPSWWMPEFDKARSLSIKANARSLGSYGGKSTSNAKRKVSAENGKKGGRPKKIQE